MAKRKNMEDEMSRFEQEINRPQMFMPRSQVIGSSTFQTTQNRLNQHAPNQHQIPAPPIPPPFLPTFQSVSRVEPSRVVLSSAPKLYSARPTTSSNIPTVELPASALLADTQIHHYDVPTVTQFEPQKVKKTKTEKSAINPMAEDIIRAAKASSALQSYGTKDKKKLDKKTLRIAGGSSWEDNSLADWPEDDFRIFCGDLGNDVNDELLTRTFSKYGSFQRSKVIRDKRTGKSKGYGFISFKEPQDFIRAMKEMDGRYVGSRPIKLRKSTWRARSMELVRRKDKEKAQLLTMFQN